jgi:hypothetical protein
VDKGLWEYVVKPEGDTNSAKKARARRIRKVTAGHSRPVADLMILRR